MWETGTPVARLAGARIWSARSLGRVWLAEARGVGAGNTGGATGSRANLVRAFVGKDLDVDVQMDGGSGSERAAQGERRHPEIHVDSFRLFIDRKSTRL